MKDSLFMGGDRTFRNFPHSLFRAGTFVVLAVSLCGSLPALAEWSLFDGALVHPEYHGQVPKHSDVIFSTRFKRPEALEVAAAFSATRAEWVYSTDKDFITALKSASGGWFGGALNSNGSGIQQVQRPSDEAMAKDFDGNSLIHPLMKSWGGTSSTPTTHPGRIVTSTHPVAEKVLREQAKVYLELGANSIQVDDPMLQVYAGIYLGGDFNPATQAGFNKWLAEYPDKQELNRVGLDNLDGNYREFLTSKFGIRNTQDYLRRYKTLPTTPIWIHYLRDTVREHFAEFRKFLNATAGRPVPLSMNLGILQWPDEKLWHFFLAPYADYAMAETPIINTWELASRAATARAVGIGYAPSIKPRSLAENRVAIATLYALGGVPVVPWDVYAGNDDQGKAKRFFGSPEQYSDLYSFVRTHTELFDNKELAAVIGIPVPVHNFNTKATAQLVQRLADARVTFAFILTGGTEDKFRIDLARVRHYKALVLVNSESDFRPDDLHDIKSHPLKRIDASELTDDTLRDLSPFVAAGDAIALKLYPRISVNGDHRLIVHVIDENRGDQKGDLGCKRRIGLKKDFIGQRKITTASWFSGGLTTELQVTDGIREKLVTLPECTLWGILEI